MAMMTVAPDIAQHLMEEIQLIERGTDLKRVAVISRTGMKIASGLSAEMDADAETASSAALIELADKLSDSVENGDLREIIIKADSGFVILQFINEEYMIFGGISNLLRVGYYLEYLRSRAHRFAFIIAGNQLTSELQKEIESQKDREKKMLEAQKAPLAGMFASDKSENADLKAMEGVLSFLNEWGDDGDAPAPNDQNIVGIDTDMTFAMEDLGNLAPAPISQDQISKARQIADDSGQDPGIDDILAMISGDAPAANAGTSVPMSSGSPIAPVQDEIGLPDDILASLDEIAETVSASKKSKPSQDIPFGIPIYEGEVPPVPLEDYISFEIGSLTGVHEQASSAAAAPLPNNQFQTQSQDNFKPTDEPVSNDVPIGANGTPNFDHIESEYDADFDLEEDVMLQALEELGLNEKKKTE